MSALNCDLHCHSTASDGLLPPAAVAVRAAGNGVTLLALTDHDTIAGLAAARAQAEALGMGFCNGVEISVIWNDTLLHVVGLGFDADNATLINGLGGLAASRSERAARMSAELERVGIDGALAGALRYAGNPDLISRAHFARYLVERGVCRDVRSVFESYLVPGKPGYVDHRWAELAEAIGWIRGAGGIAVLAHPGRYKINRKTMRRLLGEFRDLGGEGIEVVSGSHSLDDVGQYGQLAREFGYLASRGSDFHGPEESYADLGRLSALPDGLTPVWERLL